MLSFTPSTSSPLVLLQVTLNPSSEGFRVHQGRVVVISLCCSFLLTVFLCFGMGPPQTAVPSVGYLLQHGSSQGHSAFREISALLWIYPQTAVCAAQGWTCTSVAPPCTTQDKSEEEAEAERSNWSTFRGWWCLLCCGPPPLTWWLLFCFSLFFLLLLSLWHFLPFLKYISTEVPSA